MTVSNWTGWVGREQMVGDTIGHAPLRGLAALLDRESDVKVGDPVRAGAHWLYFLPAARQAELGEDGLPKRGGFLPPIDLPRRMWAGSRIAFSGILRVGDPVTLRSTIASVVPKEGRSGRMVFVTVQHDVTGPSGLAVREEQDIVYREASSKAAATSAGRSEAAKSDLPVEARRIVVPATTLLFRFSALTFNSHRIHYDLPYATGVEGYPNLVVHGPLIATLLLDLLQEKYAAPQVRTFRFRATEPLFVGTPFEIVRAPPVGGTVTLLALTPSGRPAMTAEAEMAT
ncbi:MAG: MaoC family dehydratase N-terminal domain-containing protein [Hyphomicrobiaceae bacterium]